MSFGQPKATDDPYWKEQGKVWVEVSPGRKRLVDLNKPAPTPVARSDFPAPNIISDCLSDPLQSMATGKMYDSRSELLKTYKADGNPQRENYHVIGDEPLKPFERPKDTKADIEARHRAVADTLNAAGM